MLPTRSKNPEETFRDYCAQRTSVAIALMLKGLRSTDEERGFEIAMDTYGRSTVNHLTGKVKCFGCAATAAVQSTFQRPLTPQEVSSSGGVAPQITGSQLEDMLEFEEAINGLRQGRIAGRIGPLLNYLGLSSNEGVKHHVLKAWYEARCFRLTSAFKPEDLEPYEQLAEDLWSEGY